MRNGNSKKDLDYTFYLVFDAKSRMHNFINERQQLRQNLMVHERFNLGLLDQV